MRRFLNAGQWPPKDAVRLEELINYFTYIDNILEAEKVLVSEMGGTLLTIAKDVKVQVEVNHPAASSGATRGSHVFIWPHHWPQAAGNATR